MADKYLQFLDIPRKDPDKLPVEVRTTEFREIYSQYGAETAGATGGPLPVVRQSVLRMEMPRP